MLNAIDTAASFDADTLARRESLRIQPLIEFPRLRSAMGLDGIAQAAVIEAPRLPQRPVNRPAEAAPVATKPAKHARNRSKAAAMPLSKRLAGTQARRFDRRALLDSDAG